MKTNEIIREMQRDTGAASTPIYFISSNMEHILNMLPNRYPNPM